MQFTGTYHCRSGYHCRTCRSRDLGRPWRSAVAMRYEVPGGTTDWECPQGKPWGFQGSPTPPWQGEPAVARPLVLRAPVIEPPYVAQRQAACDACDVLESACPVKARRTMKPCWFGAYIARPGAVCLANPPRWPR